MVEAAQLKLICPGVQSAVEAGVLYYLLPGLELPEGCTPNRIDALFRPSPGDGYNARLFVAQKIATPNQRNWNGELRLLERTWFAISWQLETTGLSTFQILQILMDAYK